MSILKKVLVLAALLALPALALQAQGPGQTAKIDSFNSGIATTEVIATAAMSPVSDQGTNAAIEGGERDLTAVQNGGFLDVKVDAGGVTGLLLLSADSTTTGSGEVTWDGTDGLATLDCTTGLMNFDLTDGGTDTRLRLKDALSDKDTDITFTVYTTCANYSSLTQTLSASLTATTDFDFLFASFADTGSGADFTDVSAIVLFIDAAVTATDFQSDFVTTPVELVTFTALAEVEGE